MVLMKYDKKLFLRISATLSKEQNRFSTFDDLLNIAFHVPQESILPPLLFNIYICDLFLLNENVNFAFCADDTTSFITGKNVDKVISHLEVVLFNIADWFFQNKNYESKLRKIPSFLVHLRIRE